MISDLLLKYGLSDKEILVYSTLLQKGKASATELSRHTKINRTTIYSVAKELMNKGFINEDKTQTPSAFVPLPPQDLKTLIAREEQHLHQRKNLMDQLIPELLSISPDTAYSPPKIVFKTEEEFEEYLYQQSPIWTKSIMQYDGGQWWGFQDHTFVEQYHAYIDWHWENMMQSGMKLCLLTNKSDIESSVKNDKRWPDQRQIKFWSKSDFTGTMWVCGDYVTMAITREKPHYLIEIYDKTMAHNLRTLFKEIWKSVPDQP